MDSDAGTPSQGQAWLIWALGALFYAYEFFLRISPTVIVDDMMRGFSATAGRVGDISAYYFYAYAVMQIPVGICIDHFGIRKSLFFATLAVALGCGIFSIAENIPIALMGRVLMGMGSAFAFIGCLKIGALWFSKTRFGLIVGLTDTLGIVGAIIGAAPLAYWIAHSDWRHCLMLCAWAGLPIAFLILWLLKEHPDEKNHLREKISFSTLHRLFKTSYYWRVAIYAALMDAPIAAFAELWGVPFIMLDLGITKPEAAFLSSLIFVGIGVGGLILGMFSRRNSDRVKSLFIGNIGAMLSLLFILYFPFSKAGSQLLISKIEMGVGLFCFGFFTSSMLLSFVLNREAAPQQSQAIVIALTNMTIMTLGPLFQPVCGYWLDHLEVRHYSDNIPVFSIHAYHQALGLLPVCQAIALGLLFTLLLSKEKE